MGYNIIICYNVALYCIVHAFLLILSVMTCITSTCIDLYVFIVCYSLSLSMIGPRSCRVIQDHDEQKDQTVVRTHAARLAAEAAAGRLARAEARAHRNRCGEGNLQECW